MMPKIHDTAIIGKNVKIGKRTSVGPYTTIEKNVEIGEDCTIDSCVRIFSGVKMGHRNQVLHGAVLGGPPQKIGVDPKIQSGVSIGNDNTFREYCTVHRSIYEGEKTILGHDNYIMATGHIAHDCILTDGIVICNGVLLAGHVTIGEKSFISGNVVIHQFCNIGEYVMIGGGSRITQDCPHYALAVGANGARIFSINSVGLRRAGFSWGDQKIIKEAFRTIFWSDLAFSEIKRTLREHPHEYVQKLADFLENSTRGICSGRKRKSAIDKSSENS